MAEIIIGGAIFREEQGRVRTLIDQVAITQQVDLLTRGEIDEAARNIGGAPGAGTPMQDIPDDSAEAVAALEPPEVAGDLTGRNRDITLRERAQAISDNFINTVPKNLETSLSEWKTRRKSRNWGLGGLLPLNSRNKEEIDFMVTRQPGIYLLIPVLMGVPGIIGHWWQDRGTAIHQISEQTVAYGQSYLDPAANNKGAGIVDLVRRNSSGVKMDDKDSWGEQSNFWQTARNFGEFWKAVEDPGARKILINRLPPGSAKNNLISLGDRELTDDEVAAFLQLTAKLDPTSVDLVRQIAEEFEKKDGNVTNAYLSAKKTFGIK